MNIPTPHYLLFSEAALEGATGRWRFMLQALADGQCLEAEASERCGSDQRLQLLAVVRGLEALDQPSQVTLVTSSRYVQRGFRFGLKEWRQRDWQWEHFGAMKPIPNADLWRRVNQAMRYHAVACRRWQYARQAAAEPVSHSLLSVHDADQCVLAAEHSAQRASGKAAASACDPSYHVSSWRGWRSASRWAAVGLARLAPKTAAVGACLLFCN